MDLSWDEALEALTRFGTEVRAAEGDPDFELLATRHPAAAEAALVVLERLFVAPGPMPELPDGLRTTRLMSWASMALRGRGREAALFERVVFRVGHTADYRHLMSLLAGTVDEDTFERAVLGALGKGDEIAARAVDIQYSAWGFDSGLRLSESGAKEVAEAIALLRRRRDPSRGLAGALSAYQAPPPRR